MTKRKQTIRKSSGQQQQPQLQNLMTVRGADQLRRVTSQLQQQGFIAAPMPNDFGRQGDGSGNKFGPTWEDYVHAQLCTGDNRSWPSLHLSSGSVVPTPDNIGTPGLGYVTWGADNRKPNVISLLTEASPYTASAHRFNTDLCAGRGPRSVFNYVQYVGGNITEKTIPHKDAGVLLKGWLRDLRRELQKEQQEQQQQGGGASSSVPAVVNGAAPVPGGSSSGADTPLIRDLKEQIAEIEAQLAQWKKDNDAVQEFLRRSNLQVSYLSLTGDMQEHNICFPELTLNKRQTHTVHNPETGKDEERQVPTSLWTPQITGLRYRMAHTCRLEERNPKTGRIEHVYISNQWLDQLTVLGSSASEQFKIDALPALDPQAPVTDLERVLRETRSKNGSIRRRPTRFILPVVYPSAGRPYYPVPANQSIYSGDIYEYLMTMISDRNKRRKNANVIGRILYLNNEYMNHLYFQKKADSNEQKMEVFNELRNQINSFLEDRDNMGKPLVAYTFLGSDGKTYESWKIVEIEANDKGSVEANQKELAEISSVVFFAYGLDSRLVGNTPGDVTSSGGTDLRERYMLKQLQMSPMQALLLTPLYVVSQFNQWQTVDWEIPREVLTTLDNSKTGITTQPQP